MEVHQGFSFEHGFIPMKNFAERERPEEPLKSGHAATLLQHLADAGHLLLGEPEGGDGGVGGGRGGEGAGGAGDLAPSQS